MASFQAKIGGKTQRNKEYKNCRSVPTRRVIENSKKQQKNSKISLWHHFKPKQIGKCQERENIKFIVPFHSNTTRNRKFKKKQQKNSNI